VELTLMKIAAIAQKKNSGLNLPEEEKYPLPDLSNQSQPTVTKQVEQPQPTVQAAPGTVQSAPTAQPVAQPMPTPQPVAQPSATPAPQPVAQPVVTATAATATAAAASTATSASQPTARPMATRSRIGGLVPGGSLTSLLNRVSGAADGEGDAVHHVDPESEQKLTAHREEIIDMLAREYPMLKSVLGGLRFAGNKMVLEVPTDSLREELRHTRSDIVDSVALAANINGMLDLEVILKEVEVKLRPVKLEDRLRHIESKTGEVFHTLCKALDLDVE
jgi:hypothetical protein